MEWLVERKARKSEYTIGKFYVNGKRYCDSLEDKDRGLTSEMSEADIRKIKIYGQTAIPTGRYEVESFWWQKHQCFVPHIKGVKGFVGILIHNGVDQSHTEGCVLVGINNIVGKLNGDRIYMDALTARLLACEKKGEKVYITIK